MASVFEFINKAKIVEKHEIARDAINKARACAMEALKIPISDNLTAEEQTEIVNFNTVLQAFLDLVNKKEAEKKFPPNPPKILQPEIL